MHAPELPVLGRDSARLGLGLWNHMALALTLEMLLAAAWLALYLSGEGGGRRGRLGVVILMVIFSILTVAGMTVSAPPDLNVAGASWVVVPLVLGGIGYWLDGGAGAVSSG